MRDTHSLRKLLFIFALTACSSATPGTTTGDDDDTAGPDAGMVEPDPDASLTVKDDGFVVIEGVRWSAGVSPTITGTVSAPMTQVEVRRGGTKLGMASVSGTTWTFDVSPGLLGTVPVELTFIGQIGDGAQVVVKQSYAADLTPPVLGVAQSKMSDERNDNISLADDGAITAQVHAAPTIDLAAAGCPDVFKHAYLMDPGDSNPIRWQLTATDDGIGLDLATAQVRFGIPGGDFGAFRPITGTIAGTTATFQVDALRTEHPFIATTEGKLAVQLSIKDKLGREVQSERCWTNHPLAVPLKLTVVHQAILQPLALLHNRLGSGPSFNLASEMINPGSKGLALMDYELFNGTEEPAILTIKVDRPTLTTRRDYVRRTVKTSVTNLSNSAAIDCATNPDGCDGAANPPAISSVGSTIVEDDERWTVRIVRFAPDLSSFEEVPCSTCDFANGVFTFTLPGKASPTDQGVHYTVMTGARELAHLMPSGAPGDVDFNPISDFSLIPGVNITGKFTSATRTGCTGFIFLGGKEKCNQTSKFRDYRALTFVDVRISGTLANHLSSSPAGTVPPRLFDSRVIPASIGYVYSVGQTNIPAHAP